MKTPKQKAEELISDFIQMQLNSLDDMKKQYEMAKVQAEYCAYVAKYSNKDSSEDFAYWESVQLEVKSL